MDESPQDIILGTVGWAPERPKRPSRPTIMVTNAVVTRQTQPDVIAPAAAIITPPFWALTSLIMGVILIVSKPWEVDMHLSSVTGPRVALGIAAAILVWGAHLDIQKRKAEFLGRQERRKAPIHHDLNTERPRLVRVA